MLYVLTGAALFALGLAGLVVRRHPLRKLLAANVAGTGVFLVLVGLAAVRPAAVPDPVAHALVLTGIVVAVAATGLGVGLAVRLRQLEAAGPAPTQSAPATAAPAPSEPPAARPGEGAASG